MLGSLGDDQIKGVQGHPVVQGAGTASRLYPALSLSALEEHFPPRTEALQRALVVSLRFGDVL